MTDREFKIKITTEADTAAARSESDALREVGKSGTAAHESISEASNKTEVSHRALRVILGNLGPEFAHVGHEAVYAFANPVTAGAIGLTLVIGALVKHFQDLEEAAKAAGDSLSERLEKFQEGMRKATESIKESDEKFADWYHHLDERTGAIIKRLETIKERIAALPGGEVSKPVLVERATAQALQQAQAEEAAAKAAALAAHLQATDPHRKKELDLLPERLAAANAELKLAESAKAPTFTRGAFGIPHLTTSDDELAFADAQRPGIDSARSKRDALILKQSQISEAQRNADAVAEQAKRRASDAASQVKALTDAHEQSIGPAENAAFPKRLAGTEINFGEAIAAEEAVGLGQKLGAGQAAAVSGLVGFLQQHGATQDQIIRILEALKSTTTTHRQKLEYLEAQFKNARPT